MPMTEKTPPEHLLQWYISAGVDETIGDLAVNHFEQRPETPRVSRQKPQNDPVLFQSAPQKSDVLLTTTKTLSLAKQASSLQELKEIIADFDECPLKKTATNMVFGAGNPQAQLMIIGEAPGAQEDLQGQPFVGPSGHLLDLMLHSVGLDRTEVYISNILPWRPPANRKPSESEIALFTPFIRRHIALIKPKVLLLLGGSAVSALMQTNAGITKIRGRWLTYTDEELTIDAIASFHPAFLLRTPAQKKLSWRDFLAVKKRLTA